MITTPRRFASASVASALAIASLAACSVGPATPTQSTEVVAAVPTAVTTLPTENPTPVSTETAIAVVVTAAGVSRFDTNGNVVSGDSAGEPIEFPIQTFVYGKDVFSISNGKVEIDDEQLNQYKWLEKIVGDVFNLSETKGSISVTDENGVTTNGQVVEVYLIDDGSGSKYILPIVKMDDGKMKAIWSVNISTGESGPMAVDQTSEGWRWAEGFDLQLEDWGEVVKEPELVGVLGHDYDTSGEMANLPIMTMETPENPNYPLVRDSSGNPILGVLWYDNDFSTSVSKKALVMVGRISMAKWIDNDFVLVKLDVPVGNGKYISVNTKQFVPLDCNSQFAGIHETMYPLSELYEQAGKPIVNQFPIQVDMNSQDGMVVRHASNACTVLNSFHSNGNSIGAQMGIVLTDKMYATKEEIVDTSEIFEMLVNGNIAGEFTNINTGNYGTVVPDIGLVFE